MKSYTEMLVYNREWYKKHKKERAISIRNWKRLNKEKVKQNIKHWIKLRPEFTAYQNILQRCNNKKHVLYKYYGGRDIENKLTSWHDIIFAIGKRPSKEYSIDRIDNNGPYAKWNIRWATRKQ